MILVKIRGGLSNQLFQYACARALAHRHKTRVVIDRSWFDQLPSNVTPRLFDIAHFNITASYASPW
ncbi:MAG: alpha-1,2-fucosyltransferase, partial [Bacteroidia bacterium]